MHSPNARNCRSEILPVRMSFGLFQFSRLVDKVLFSAYDSYITYHGNILIIDHGFPFGSCVQCFTVAKKWNEIAICMLHVFVHVIDTLSIIERLSWFAADLFLNIAFSYALLISFFLSGCLRMLRDTSPILLSWSLLRSTPAK